MNMQPYPGVEFDDTARGLLSPADYENPQPQSRYHLVVVGAGPAGLISAIGAAGLGAKVALIERHRMGGDCLNVGCMPSKSLLAFSKRPDADFQQAFAWLREVRAGIAPTIPSIVIPRPGLMCFWVRRVLTLGGKSVSTTRR